MVATVLITEKQGATGTWTDKTSGTVRFKNAAGYTVDTADPMVIPAAGSDWSYTKWLILRVTTAASTYITNVLAYSDGGGFGTGVTTYAKAKATYSAPVEPATNSGYAGLFTYTVGGALTLRSTSFTGTGEVANHLVLLMEVASTATQGALTAETLTISYDEV